MVSMDNFDFINNKSIQQGYMLLENHQGKKALSHFKELACLFPNDSNVLVGLARAYWAVDKTNKAFKIANDALSANPNCLDSHVLLRDLHTYISRNYRKAEVHGLKAIELRPCDSYMYAFMSQLYYHKKMQQKCYDFANEALKLNPENDMAHMTLGLYYAKKMDYKKSKKHYYKSLELSPNDPITIANLGLLNLNLSKTKEGYQLIRDAIRINPVNKQLQSTFKEAFIQNHPDHKPILWLTNSKTYYLLLLPAILICGIASGSLFLIVPVIIIIRLLAYCSHNSVSRIFEKALANGTLKNII